MYNPYNERVCKGCPFTGNIYMVPIGSNDIKYIDCKRDNADAQEHFLSTNSNDSLKLWAQQTEFLHCLYANSNSCKDENNE